MMTTLVELVKLGFLGFAVALMLLAYRSLSTAMNTPGLPASQLQIIARETRVFIFSLVVVIGLGLVFEYRDPQITLFLDVSPDDIGSDQYKIKYEGRILDLATDKAVVVRHSRELTLDLVALDRIVRGAAQQIKNSKEAQKDRIIEETKAAGLEGESGL